MSRERRARPDNSEMDTDGAELELAKLQRQLRTMEKDHQAYSLQAREQIRKQEQEIEMLLKEQDELHRNLGACESASRQLQDGEDSQRLRALLKQDDMLEEALQKEKQCQKEIEKEISQMQVKLAALRKQEASAGHTQRSTERHTHRTVATMENKLDKALTCFNKQLAKNSHLREELQTLHKERGHFQELKNRLEKELQDIRKQIGEMISLSTAAYDARVEAQSKMTMLKEKAVKDLAQYNIEMKILERVVAHECSLKEFMTIKCLERNGQDEDHEAGNRQQLKEQRRMDSEESLDTLEEVFKRIQTVTEEDNLDMLVTRFIQVEDRNFALFNFINGQNNEADEIRDQITQIQAETEQFHSAELQREKDHRSLLRDIEEQQQKIESQTEDYENQTSRISKIMDEVKAEVNNIFSKVDCNRSVIERRLDSSTGINENNIMSYLGLVEQKANELLTMQAFLTSKDLEKGYNPKDLAKHLLGQNPELLQQSYSIRPEINVAYDAEESQVTTEDERPFSQEELRNLIIQGVLQKQSSRQQAANKAGQQTDG